MNEIETVQAIYEGIMAAARNQGILHEIGTGLVSDGAAELTRNGDEYQVIISAQDGKITFSGSIAGSAAEFKVGLEDPNFDQNVKDILGRFQFPYQPWP